jgi:hypothetical protein
MLDVNYELCFLCLQAISYIILMSRGVNVMYEKNILKYHIYVSL